MANLHRCCVPSQEFENQGCSTCCNNKLVSNLIVNFVTLGLYAGPATETHPDGTPVAQAQIAWHAAEGSRPILAMALGHTLYIAALDSFDSKAPVPEWDCTDTSDLPLSSMTSMQLADDVRCLAFSPDGNKLAAVNSAEKVRFFKMQPSINDALLMVFLQHHFGMMLIVASVYASSRTAWHYRCLFVSCN